MIDGTEEEGLTVVLKEHKAVSRKGHAKDEPTEYGRVTIPIDKLEAMNGEDQWYTLSTRKNKQTLISIRLIISYKYSKVSLLH